MATTKRCRPAAALLTTLCSTCSPTPEPEPAPPVRVAWLGAVADDLADFEGF